MGLLKMEFKFKKFLIVKMNEIAANGRDNFIRLIKGGARHVVSFLW